MPIAAKKYQKIFYKVSLEYMATTLLCCQNFKLKIFQKIENVLYFDQFHIFEVFCGSHCEKFLKIFQDKFGLTVK